MKTLLLLFAILAASAASADEALRVGRIEVRTLDVYSHDEAKHGFVYRMADRLHVETRTSVIEKFLLFREGDLYRPERLAETERNLRALPFLKSASVVASAPHDGVVDVAVTTQDSWTIAPETSAGNRGGAATFGATLSETNLLGWGKEVSLGWNKGVDRTRIAIDYNDRSFFRPYWQSHVAYSHNSDGFDHRFNIRRPFYSFATTWATELSSEGFKQEDKLYDRGRVSSRFQQQHHATIVAFGRALRADDVIADRLTAGVRLVDDDFIGFREREFRYVFTRYEHLENDFLKLNFINKDMRYEDFNLGRQYSVETAISPRALHVANTTGFASVGAAQGRRIGAESFVLPAVALQTRVGGGLRNAIASANVAYVNRTDGRYPRVLVGRFVMNDSWRLDPETQFAADGMTGLRGYRLHAFTGSRSMIMNVEQRLYLGRELLQLYSPGVVAFIDSGNASYGGYRQLLRLKTDVGIGIRLGLPRTPKNLLRFDVSYALNRDPFGKRGLLVSFSSGQAF